MTMVVNQYGKVIDGEARDTIVEKVFKDKDTISFDGHIVSVKEVSTDEKGNKIIKVEV